jgi:hypothetical protein
MWKGTHLSAYPTMTGTSPLTKATVPPPGWPLAGLKKPCLCSEVQCPGQPYLLMWPCGWSLMLFFHHRLSASQSPGQPSLVWDSKHVIWFLNGQGNLPFENLGLGLYSWKEFLSLIPLHKRLVQPLNFLTSAPIRCVVFLVVYLFHLIF